MKSTIYAKKVQSILLKWWNAKHTLNKPPVLKFLLYVSHSELKLGPNKILKISMAYYNYAEFHAAAVSQVSFIKELCITAPFLFFIVLLPHLFFYLFTLEHCTMCTLASLCSNWSNSEWIFMIFAYFIV
jgi:hypothetical protein